MIWEVFYRRILHTPISKSGKVAVPFIFMGNSMPFGCMESLIEKWFKNLFPEELYEGYKIRRFSSVISQDFSATNKDYIFFKANE